jgi:hypothetical protein
MIIGDRDPVPGIPSPAGAFDTVRRVPLPTGQSFELAVVPAPDTGIDVWLEQLVPAAREWVDDPEACVAIPLFGTLTVWGPRRAIVAATADRIASLETAVVEFASLEADLRDVEAALAAALPRVDADAPAAFAFDDASHVRRGELAVRFREAIAVRRRLATLAPVLHRPAPQPPTLAGQLGERLRERTRIVDRAGFATEQADLLERVYTACGERASDFAIARRQATLEWTIIVLLAAEVVLMLVGALTTGTT